MKNAFIIRDPKILAGKPIIKGTRISVELIMRKLGSGYSIEDILESYPHLKKEQIQACFEYMADVLASEEIVEIA